MRRLESLKRPCTTDYIKIVDEKGNPLKSGDRELIPADLDMSQECNRKALTKYLSHDYKPGAKFSGGERMYPIVLLQDIVDGLRQSRRSFYLELLQSLIPSSLCLTSQPAI